MKKLVIAKCSFEGSGSSEEREKFLKALSEIFGEQRILPLVFQFDLGSETIESVNEFIKKVQRLLESGYDLSIRKRLENSQTNSLALVTVSAPESQLQNLLSQARVSVQGEAEISPEELFSQEILVVITPH